MPWIPATSASGETPAHYCWIGLVLSDDTVCGRNIEYGKAHRKKIGQYREEFLKFQKECGQRKDIETARFFRDKAAELMKQYRGFDLAIKIIEGGDDWKHNHVSEQIAPYVDAAFAIMDYEIDV